MQVIFSQRHGKYFPGANPVLDPALAQMLIGRGVCRPMCAPPAAPAVNAEAPPDEPTDLEPTLPAEEAVGPAPRKRGRRS